MQALDLNIPTILIVILLPSRDICVDGHPKPFDYYTLAMQWPGTVCKQAPCPDHWTIHGLWPSKNHGFGPSDCGGQLHVNDVANINGLDEMWPDLKNKQNFDFWKVQWKKHGSCAKNIFNHANTYFTKAVELAGRYDIKRILENNQMYPNSQNRFQIWKIRDAIYAETEHHSKVKTCENRLFEIEICFDKNFNVIHCKDYSTVYPLVQPNQQQLQQPQPLIQANEGQCQFLSNGQTQINFIAPVLQLMIILLTQPLIF